MRPIKSLWGAMFRVGCRPWRHRKFRLGYSRECGTWMGKCGEDLFDSAPFFSFHCCLILSVTRSIFHFPLAACTNRPCQPECGATAHRPFSFSIAPWIFAAPRSDTNKSCWPQIGLARLEQLELAIGFGSRSAEDPSMFRQLDSWGGGA